MKEKYFIKRVVSLLLLLIMEICFCYPISYSGISLTPITYSGALVYPLDVKGQSVYPISRTGSYINGIYYEGFDLKNTKISVITITGYEQSSDFFLKEVPKEFQVNWPKVIGKYAIGTTIIAVTGVITLVTGAETGFIAAGAFKGALEGAIIGAFTDALITSSIGAIKGNPKEQIFKETIEASADGFMWGAIIGSVTGGFKASRQLKAGQAVLNSKGKIVNLVTDDGYVLKPTTGEIQGRVLEAQTRNGQYALYFDTKGQLCNFDGKIISSCPSTKQNGVILDLVTKKKVGYIDSNGVLSLGDDIQAAISKDIRIVPVEIKCSPEIRQRIKIVDNIIIDSDGVKWNRQIARTEEIVVEFNNNGYDFIEFQRQLTNQQNGMNGYSVYDYVKNRTNYIQNGRTNSNSVQQAVREEAKARKITELRKNGISRIDAEKQADEWLKTQAALHNPDQVAGGNPFDITDIGDANINSSIGSQWAKPKNKPRIVSIDEVIKQYVESMTDEELKKIFMNVILVIK